MIELFSRFFTTRFTAGKAAHGNHRPAGGATPPTQHAATARGPATPTVAPTGGPKFQVQFDPMLIDSLTDDHHGLLDLYGQIDAASREGRWSDVSVLLPQLRSRLTDHLLVEGVKLYCYLQHAVPEDDETHDTFRAFKTEMAQIGRTAFNFVDRYSNATAFVSPASRTSFLNELKVIGEVLSDRIRREEAMLYPLYGQWAPAIQVLGAPSGDQ